MVLFIEIAKMRTRMALWGGGESQDLVLEIKIPMRTPNGGVK